MLPSGLWPSGSMMQSSGSIMFGPSAAYFPVSLGQGWHIVPMQYMTMPDANYRVQTMPHRYMALLSRDGRMAAGCTRYFESFDSLATLDSAVWHM